MLPFNEVITEESISTEGLAFYAPLGSEQLVGNTFRSMDRYGHLCTVTGALWTLQGRILDGDDYIDCGRLTQPTNKLTLGMWFKDIAWVAASFRCGQVSPTAAGYNWGFYTGADGKDFRFYAGTPTGISPDSLTVALNTPYCLFGTYDGAFLREIVNGVSVATPVAETAPCVDSGYNFLIGKWNNKFSQCVASEVVIDTTTAWSEAKIQQYYQATKWRYQ